VDLNRRVEMTLVLPGQVERFRVAGVTGHGSRVLAAHHVTYFIGPIPQTVVGGDTLVRVQLANWNSEPA